MDPGRAAVAAAPAPGRLGMWRRNVALCRTVVGLVTEEEGVFRPIPSGGSRLGAGERRRRGP